MGRRIFPFLAIMLALAVLGPAVPVQAENAPYVNAVVADTEFDRITAQDMDVIRSKKILLVGYSGSLCMRSGLCSLSYGNNMYCIVPKCPTCGSFDYSIRDGIPVRADAFSLQNFVHYKGPNDGAIAPESLDEEIRTKFSGTIDVAMIFGDAVWGNYKTVMDQLRADFPNIKFIYSTPSYKSYCETDPAIIEERAAYIASIRSRYKNVAPLYDLAALTGDDGRCGNQACTEYFTTDCIHYNSAFIESLMGKAFLVMLHKLFVNPTNPVCGSNGCETGETCSSCPADCACPTQNLVAHWKFDETFGTTASDSSGNNNPGTLVNSPTWTGGKLGNALSFDGVNDYVDAGQKDLLTGNFSLSVWFKANSFNTAYLVCQQKQSSSQDRLDIPSANTLRYRFVSTLGTYYNLTVTINSNQWYHAVVVMNGSTNALLYLNGIQADQTNLDSGDRVANPSYKRFTFGSTQVPDNFFNGSIDDVRIYNYALNASEIQAIHKSAFHKSDSDCNGCVSDTELSAFIDRWKINNQDATLKEIIEAIGLWKRGC